MKRPSSLPADSVPTRERLITTAAEVFDRAGYDGASISGITSAASLSTGSLYHFAKGKPRLARLVFDAALERFHAAVLPKLAGPFETPRAVIQAAIAAHIAWALTHPQDLRLLGVLAMVGAAPRRRTQQSRVVGPVQAALAAALGPWKQTGDVRPLPPGLLHAVVLGPVTAASAQAITGDSNKSETLENWLNVLVDAAVASVVTPAVAPWVQEANERLDLSTGGTKAQTTDTEAVRIDDVAASAAAPIRDAKDPSDRLGKVAKAKRKTITDVRQSELLGMPATMPDLPDERRQ